MAASDDLNMQKADMKSQLSGSASTAAASGAKSAASSAGEGLSAAGASALGSMFSAGFAAIGSLGLGISQGYDRLMSEMNFYDAQNINAFINRKSNIKQSSDFHLGWIVLGLLLLVILVKEK